MKNGCKFDSSCDFIFKHNLDKKNIKKKYEISKTNIVMDNSSSKEVDDAFETFLNDSIVNIKDHKKLFKRD